MEQELPPGVTPVQVVDNLPPVPAKPAKAPKKPNPTGLSRAEIRLLADAVTFCGAYSAGSDKHNKMKAALRKLRAAAGVR